MRNRVDIAEVEAGTKIRAKYLRALENEEWDLLPGPTFVKTFLRTYAEFLGLDARLLVEEYKLRYERPSAMELTPFGTGSGLGGRRDRRRRVAPGAVAVRDRRRGCPHRRAVRARQVGARRRQHADPRRAGQEHAHARRDPRPRRSSPGGAAATRVSLIVVPTGTVNVCLVDANGKALIDNRDLARRRPLAALSRKAAAHLLRQRPGPHARQRPPRRGARTARFPSATSCAPVGAPVSCPRRNARPARRSGSSARGHRHHRHRGPVGDHRGPQRPLAVGAAARARRPARPHRGRRRPARGPARRARVPRARGDGPRGDQRRPRARPPTTSRPRSWPASRGAS